MKGIDKYGYVEDLELAKRIIKENNIYLQYLKELMVNWRCIQKKPVGGSLILVKNDLEEDFVKTLENHLHNFKINENEFYLSGITIKLI
jgi:hypothetical protein